MCSYLVHKTQLLKCRNKQKAHSYRMRLIASLEKATKVIFQFSKDSDIGKCLNDISLSNEGLNGINCWDGNILFFECLKYWMGRGIYIYISLVLFSFDSGRR
jgi:hypothetical protein